MPRPRVVCNRPLFDDEQQRRLEASAEVTVIGDGDLGAALAEADGAIIIRPTRVTAELLDGAPRLRALATVSSGTDHVDIEAVRARGIALVSGFAAAPTAVAEWVLWAVLTYRRGLVTMVQAMHDGSLDWTTRLAGYRPTESTDVRLGVVGFGNIGREVRRLFAPFGARITVFDTAVSDLPDDCERADDVLSLCEWADVVTVHVPLTPGTTGLIGAPELAALGPEGLIVNAARGGIVDQDALVEALTKGAVGGAALDCFEPEPVDEQLRVRLAATGRALMTPHVAGVSTQAMQALCRTAVDGLLEHLAADPGPS